MNEYQKNAVLTNCYPKKTMLHDLVLGLCSEAGEVAGVLKKADRDEGGIISLEKYDMLISELGDVLWYVANVSEYLGIGLKELGDLNIKKLQSRASRDTIKGSGDNR